MGNTWEVLAWRETPNGKFQYDYVREYAGESAIAAIICAVKLKMSGVGCVKVEWR